MINAAKKIMNRLNNYISSLLRKISIFKRLIVIFVVLAVFTSAFISLYSFNKYVKEIKTNIVKYLSLLVSNAVIEIEDSLKWYEGNAVNFYDDQKVLKAIEENSRLYQSENYMDNEVYKENLNLIGTNLSILKNGNRYIKNIQFVTPYEQYNMINKGFNRGGRIKDLEKFYSSEFYIGTKNANGYPVWFDSSEQASIFYENERDFYGYANIITLGISVFSYHKNEFLGVLIFNIDRNIFNKTLEGYSFYDDGNTFLVGTEGIIFGINPSLDAPLFPNNPERGEKIFHNDNGTIEQKVDDTNIFLSYKRVHGTEFYVAHVVKEDSLLQNAYTIRNRCIYLVFILIAICVVVTYYTTNSISDPVKKLIDFMKRQQEGNSKGVCPNSGNDEITYLVDKFNEMFCSMNDLIDKVYISEIKQKEYEISNKNAQLDALQMQINPHFLYNTLDIIRWESMYLANGESNVSNMIESFSRLLRMGLKVSDENVTLAYSLEHAKLYLTVINLRHTNKIELCIDLHLYPEVFYIPQFTLQPIVENAVVHAFNRKNTDKSILITGKLEDNSVVIMVTDNGDGMSEKELSSLKETLNNEQTSESIGLYNVNQRLKLCYGKEYSITIDSILGEGTRVSIRVPKGNYPVKQ
jgi:sensor histidine kinase YesM